MNFMYWYFWFIKESFSYMKGHNRAWILFNSLVKGIGYAKKMVEWEKLTHQQREEWYLSGEGRIIEFD